MLANFLNKSKPINFIGLLVFFVFTFFITAFSDGFELSKLLKTIILLGLFFCIFFFFNFIDSKNKLTFDNTIAYFIFTLLLICILPKVLDYKILFIFVIYLLFLRKIYSLRSPRKVIQKLFDGSFWIGVLFLLEPFSLLFFLLIFAAIYLHQKITLHTLVTPLIGFLTPVFLYFTYFFWFDKTEEFTKLFYFDFQLGFYENQKFIWLLIVVLSVTIISGIFKSIEVIPVSNTFRRNWALLIINLILAIILMLFLSKKNQGEFLYMFFPMSIIIANGIQLIKKKIVKEVIFYSFLIACIFFQFFL